MSRVKPADVQFYIDADLLGLAHILIQLRSDVTFPGDQGGVVHKRERSACPVTSPSTPDDVWIPEVTSRSWLIITRDTRIQERPREIGAVREHGARMVALDGKEASDRFRQLEILFSRWRDIERCLGETGPFIYAAYRTSFRSVNLG